MTENNKYRLTAVYLKEYFEGHKHEPITREMLLDMLYAHGVYITRKTLLHYIRALREYGMDIANTRGRAAEYYYQGCCKEVTR